MNTVTEKHYTAANAQVNAMTGTGRNVYMTGAVMAAAAPEVAGEVYKQAASLVEKRPNVQPIAGFDYLPLDKVRSFADDSAAFNCRRARNNVLIQYIWQGDDDLLGEARLWSKSINAIVSKGQGEYEMPYGNYREKACHKHREAHMLTSRIRLDRRGRQSQEALREQLSQTSEPQGQV